MQELVMNAAKDKDAKGVSLASLARAWMDLERLRRDMRMLPKPKPIDVLPRQRIKRPTSLADPIEKTSAAKKPTMENIAQTVPPASSQPPATSPNAERGEQSEPKTPTTTPEEAEAEKGIS
jgi:hypothetical protein